MKHADLNQQCVDLVDITVSVIREIYVCSVVAIYKNKAFIILIICTLGYQTYQWIA